MIKSFNFWRNFGAAYLTIVVGLWGFIEAFTYFKGEQLKMSLGDYWISFYGVPVVIALGLAYITAKRQKLIENTDKAQSKLLDAASVSLYSHKNPPYNAIKILYTGSDMAKDLKVRVAYRNTNGRSQIKEIQDFFTEQDPRMIWRHYKCDFLKSNQVAYFRLPLRKTAPDGKVTVLASFLGVSSAIPVEIEKKFDLEY